MASSLEELLRALGTNIRTRRTRAEYTQDQLGKRAGIGGKYISEIERGTRDVPMSTLQSVVERGLGLTLDLQFRENGRRATVVSELPRNVAQAAAAIAALPEDDRALVLAIVRDALKLAAR